MGEQYTQCICLEQLTVILNTQNRDCITIHNYETFDHYKKLHLESLNFHGKTRNFRRVCIYCQGCSKNKDLYSFKSLV